MNETDAVRVMRAMAGAEAIEQGAADQLLALLQVEVPEVDWFRLAVTAAPWFPVRSCTEAKDSTQVAGPSPD